MKPCLGCIVISLFLSFYPSFCLGFIPSPKPHPAFVTSSSPTFRPHSAHKHPMTGVKRLQSLMEAKRGRRGGSRSWDVIDVGDPAVQSGVVSLTVTDVLLVLNAVFFIAQIASAFTAHGKMNEFMARMGRRGPSALEAGLPFSIPTHSVQRGGMLFSAQGTFTRDFVFNPALFKRPFKQTYRALSSAFLHGSGLHLGLNMWNLNRVGRMVESSFGPWLFSFVYALTALSGALLHFAVSPRNPALGASGAVMGLYGFLWHHHQRRGDTGRAQQLLRYMMNVLLFGLLRPGIGNAAHVGGFLGGAAANWLIGPSATRRPATGLYRETRTALVTGAARLKPLYLAAALLACVPAARELLWQLPAAAHLHSLHPGFLAKGVSPATVLPVGRVKSAVLKLSRL